MCFQAYNEIAVVTFHRFLIVNFHWELMDDVEPWLLSCFYRQKIFFSLSSLWEYTGTREESKTKNFKLHFRISAKQKVCSVILIQISSKYYLELQ